MSQDTEIGILKRRRIEGEIIKPIFEGMVRELGPDKARQIISEAICQAAMEFGRSLALKEPKKPDLLNFIALQPLWKKDNALVTNVLAQSETRYDYNVTHCVYAEMYREMGMGDLGFLLSCNRDEAFIKGYAPDIVLTRTKTIMAGDSHCDFRYLLSKK